MSAPNTIVVAGNLTAAPDYRKTASEIPYVRLRMAVSRRIFVAETNSWEDRQDGFFSVTAWRDLAVHCSHSLHKGDRVVVVGRLTHREFDVVTEEGTESRQVTEIEADEIGGSLRWHAWTKVHTRPLNEVEPLPAGVPRTAADPAEPDAGEDVAVAA
jgi:single-strand DNA-binding protein